MAAPPGGGLALSKALPLEAIAAFGSLMFLLAMLQSKTDHPASEFEVNHERPGNARRGARTAGRRM